MPPSPNSTLAAATTAAAAATTNIFLSLTQWYYGNDGNDPFGPAPGGLGRKNQMLKTEYGNFPTRECWSPHRQPGLTVIYFIAFVLIAAFVIFSFFIGAVCGGMSDALEEFEKEEENLRRKQSEKLANEADPKYVRDHSLYIWINFYPVIY